MEILVKEEGNKRDEVMESLVGNNEAGEGKKKKELR